ncbi:dipeptidase [Paenibacillus eucommiae]|uniref:Membrane dipeptidase n=1 Tax=Paenibacillus eucommiae TaxID=1355755 RepID=A0ABS4IUS8_9BACL|nr:dipeptidase [Paenibacillus eucommiae]MBP1991258.1 membrane dipeptidase [Paenibacillus eucommiae]
MHIIDAHCDALSKLYLNPRLDFYKEEKELDVSYPRLQKSKVKIQCFAIYMPEQIQQPTFEHVRLMIDIFYKKIIGNHSQMRIVNSIKDFHEIMNTEQTGAILTLEGADALAGNIAYVQDLYQAGVRIIGITWNYANWAADGVMEPRKGGFTIKGKRLIKEMERIGMIVDVSHLSIAGFWELMDMYSKPFIASHSNSAQQCGHPRNLSDDQIRAIISRKGQIGLTFVPYFVKSQQPVQIKHLLVHLDHICALGGEKHLGFGSDFDGIDQWIYGLENSGKFENLIEVLCQNYRETQVEQFLFGNWKLFLLQNLPEN